ncbi:MAG: hypothetical protein Q8R79_01380 [Legionellaceae bacterium]|nr:hypothetical protein [Legionellaceae bacterium]
MGGTCSKPQKDSVTAADKKTVSKQVSQNQGTKTDQPAEQKSSAPIETVENPLSGPSQRRWPKTKIIQPAEQHPSTSAAAVTNPLNAPSQRPWPQTKIIPPTTLVPPERTADYPGNHSPSVFSLLQSESSSSLSLDAHVQAVGPTQQGPQPAPESTQYPNSSSIIQKNLRILDEALRSSKKLLCSPLSEGPQCSATMIGQRINGAWQLILTEFTDEYTWILGDTLSPTETIPLERFIPEKLKKQHHKWVIDILSGHCGVEGHWDNFFKGMLDRRNLRLQHPVTGEQLSVDIHMGQDTERTMQSFQQQETRWYFSVTFVNRSNQAMNTESITAPPEVAPTTATPIRSRPFFSVPRDEPPKSGHNVLNTPTSSSLLSVTNFFAPTSPPPSDSDEEFQPVHNPSADNPRFTAL